MEILKVHFKLIPQRLILWEEIARRVNTTFITVIALGIIILNYVLNSHYFNCKINMNFSQCSMLPDM